MNEMEQSEWYNWWFSHDFGKKVLAILLILSILSPLLIVAVIVEDAYLIRHNISGITGFVKTNVSVLIGGVLAIIGISVAVLLLPSLTKIKVGNIVELETIPIHAVDAEFETMISVPSLIFVNMSTEISIRHFHMPLHSLRMPIKYPLKSTRMPLQPLHHHWDFM